MRPPTRGCVSLLSATRGSLSWRGMTARPLAGTTTGLIGIHCGPQRTSLSQLHILSRRATSDTLSTQLRSDQGGLSVSLLAGCQQARYFKKANYVEKIGDNERTEELLESLEEKHNERKTGSSRHVLDKDGKRPSTEGQDKKWSEDMTKGKLLTTPSRLFKLIIPLTTVDSRDSDKGITGIHQHPKFPPIEGKLEKLRPPAISFIALQHEDNAIKPRKKIDELETDETRRVAVEKQYSNDTPVQRRRSREEDAEIYSYPRKTDSSLDPLDGAPERFVRWSQATEIGDFVRDAARAGEFIVTIEGAPAGLGQIRVTVPSFNERTYFLRLRMRKLSRRIQSIAEIKTKCDELAHRGAQRVAIGGFGILSVWWYSVYKLTFETDLGWDTMEPVTYLVSLSTLMGGYLWFLYHNREISYKSALDFTVSTRQRKLYQQHNVDLQLWESLIDEGKTLRREIKSIAAEYDAEWNERSDEQDERVTEVLRSNRGEKDGKNRDKDDKDGDDDD
ncbi:hypothetical protein N7509_010670 [Penicillium cosmopolitanum]|uniref:Calcium uniporter protein, mitochondrial n=1 Tax=Penicillium cosmopolitanum TaxID=1131564 RepID=A0A9X0B4R5_9EURO|nr:uncharacterized protein N7509_010670 [Penicillium cosmopolitanum]KAJ5388129.1 hypothetical protein N7509_010670 [Penicillium cosmopolitanum]